MLRIIIIGLILWGAYVVATYLSKEYTRAKVETGEAPAPAPVQQAAPVSTLEGLPPGLAPSLDTARSRGPATFKKWIEINRKHIRDPKLGDIQLDYAVAVARQNSAEAKSVYAEVKARTPANSPLQPRLKRLASSFE